MSTDDAPAGVNETTSEVGNGIGAMLALSEQVPDGVMIRILTLRISRLRSPQADNHRGLTSAIDEGNNTSQ